MSLQLFFINYLRETPFKKANRKNLDLLFPSLYHIDKQMFQEGIAMAKINIGEILQTPLSLIGKIPIILIPALIASIIGLLLTLGLGGAILQVMSWQIFLVNMISSAVTSLSMAWVTIILAEELSGKKTNLLKSWIDLSKQSGNLATAIIVVSVIVTLGTFFYFIPGIILATIFLPAIPHTATKEIALDKALRFSFSFVFSQNNFLAILLLIVVEFLLSLLPLIGLFLANLFISIWLPYAYLKYGERV